MQEFLVLFLFGTVGLTVAQPSNVSTNALYVQANLGEVLVKDLALSVQPSDSGEPGSVFTDGSAASPVTGSSFVTSFLKMIENFSFWSWTSPPQKAPSHESA
jgi:hypothetical protein